MSEIEGRVQLFVPGRAEALVLNDTASAVWRLCDGSRTLDELVAELASAFDVESRAIAADVERTVSELTTHQVLAA